uniref:Lysosomal acid phosphatase n=1 Tax=Plectus sambesii TaxID=2011161 RepID=A0A914XE81_9BILA
MLAFAVIFLVTRVVCGQRAEVDTLQLAQVLFRHGERAPVNYFNFPNDPPELRTPFPAELGEMTNHGIEQLFTLGLNLRETYGEFLQYTYIPSQLRVIAGDDNRTIVSASAALAARFPPNEAQTWSSQLKWQPVP